MLSEIYANDASLVLLGPPVLLLSCYCFVWIREHVSGLAGLGTRLEQGRWKQPNALDERGPPFNPKVPGSRPGRPTTNLYWSG